MRPSRQCYFLGPPALSAPADIAPSGRQRRGGSSPAAGRGVGPAGSGSTGAFVWIDCTPDPPLFESSVVDTAVAAQSWRADVRLSAWGTLPRRMVFLIPDSLARAATPPRATVSSQLRYVRIRAARH